VTEYTPPLYDHALDEGERDRNLLWKQQLNQRAAYRSQNIGVTLRGDPIRALMLRDGFQALIDHATDMARPWTPDDEESIPPTNQDLNL
jgi:hypothetical protein